MPCAAVTAWHALLEAAALRPGRRTEPVIDRAFALDEAREAYEYLAVAKHLGKVVICV